MRGSERFNVITHLIGALLTLVGMAALIVPHLSNGEFAKAFGFAVYGASLMLCYSASVAFHSVRGRLREVFRRYDRIAIYVLIAGTYTPIALLKLPPDIGRPLLLVVLGLAVTGVFAEIAVAKRKKPLSIALYVVMGWLVLLFSGPLVESLGPAGFGLLVLAGVIYTGGAVALRYKLVPHSHEVWHVLVLLGSACCYAVMFFFVS